VFLGALAPRLRLDDLPVFNERMIPIRASMASPPFFGDQEQGLRGRLLTSMSTVLRLRKARSTLVRLL
jgi:hypothetical protein